MQTSTQEARAFLALRRAGRWLTSNELAQAAEIAERTARQYVARFAESGIAEMAKVFPP